MKRRIDVSLLIANRVDLDIAGQLRRHAGQLVLHVMDDLDRIGPGLTPDFEGHRRYPI